MIGRSIELKIDVVLLNGGVGCDIHGRLGTRRIRKVNRAGLENIAVPHKNQVATAQVNAAQNHGFIGGATHIQIGIALQAQFPAHQIDSTRRLDREVEL